MHSVTDCSAAASEVHLVIPIAPLWRLCLLVSVHSGPGLGTSCMDTVVIAQRSMKHGSRAMIARASCDALTLALQYDSCFRGVCISARMHSMRCVSAGSDSHFGSCYIMLGAFVYTLLVCICTSSDACRMHTSTASTCWASVEQEPVRFRCKVPERRDSCGDCVPGNACATVLKSDT